MSFADSYLSRFSSYKIDSNPNPNLGIVVTIPCFKEPSLLDSLFSLYRATRPSCAVEVILVINHSISASFEAKQQNEITYKISKEWSQKYSDDQFQLHVVYIPDLPEKDAGVGYARKLAMDEAVRRFDILNKPDGIITGFDADTLCQSNYFTAIEHHFNSYPKCPGASIYYEHPLDNEAIIRYELHLRYMVEALRYINFPYAFHTVGSSFAVRALAYVKQGGMSKRKAGEDFYFMNKIMALGNYAEINNTTIIPSSRTSDRVPFGTGVAIQKWQDHHHNIDTYNWQSYLILKHLFDNIHKCFHSSFPIENFLSEYISEPLLSFLRLNDFEKQMHRINSNCATLDKFYKGFFAWFDGFKIVKYLNYSHLTVFAKQDVVAEAENCLISMGLSDIPKDAEPMLKLYRKIQNVSLQ